jgi:hypothetical protein
MSGEIIEITDFLEVKRHMEMLARGKRIINNALREMINQGLTNTIIVRVLEDTLENFDDLQH